MHRQLFAAAVTMSAGAAVLWTMVIIGLWAWPVPRRAMPVVLVGASTSFVGALVCWAGLAQFDEDRRRLIRLSADLYERIPEGERPARVASVR